MQTVFRVASLRDDIDQLRVFGGMMNSVRPGTFTGTSRRGTRFSIDICDGNDWTHHCERLEQFLKTFERVLLAAKVHDVQMAVDVAMYSSEVAGVERVIIGIPPAIIGHLDHINAEFRVTFYNLEKIGDVRQRDG